MVFVKRGEKINGPFAVDKILSMAEKGKFVDGGLFSDAEEGPFWNTRNGWRGCAINRLPVTLGNPLWGWIPR
ncbi:MAG: hypothetical protein VX768_16645 [Planctomycetota bacterium]|nr:hypothetical protein [Planctomycetota bacterium]